MNELLGSKYQEFDAPLAVEGVRVEDALVLLPPALHPHGNVTSKHAGTFTRGRVHRITSQLHQLDECVTVRQSEFEEPVSSQRIERRKDPADSASGRRLASGAPTRPRCSRSPDPAHARPAPLRSSARIDPAHRPHSFYSLRLIKRPRLFIAEIRGHRFSLGLLTSAEIYRL